MKHEHPLPEFTYQHLLDEISHAIEIEYAILEEQELSLPDLELPINPVLVDDYDFAFSEDCLLCPFCRSSVMTNQRINHPSVLYQCPNCSNQIFIKNSSNHWNVTEFCTYLAQIFDRYGSSPLPSYSRRHQQVCCHRNQDIPNSVDIFLTFKQVNDFLYASCDQCGYNEEILLP